MNGYTVFISYFFTSLSGYTQAIHCNYIDRLEVNPLNPYIEKIRLGFSDINDFKFLNGNISATTGYSANKVYALVQLVHYTGVDSLSDVKPDPALWKAYELTYQIPTYLSGTTRLLSAADMMSVVFEIPLLNYDNLAVFQPYNLIYLNYPVAADTESLSFGDEVYFFGNVTTDIKANVYVTDLSINLLLDEFNDSTNPTWDGTSPVAITEIGIYDTNKNLVAIGKLNNPIEKDSTISRTIVFAIDF